MNSKKDVKKNYNSSHTHTEYMYILSIKRNIYKSLEIIGVYSNISKAKNIVKNNFNNYIEYLRNNKTPENEKVLSKINEWKYNNKNWEHSKQDHRFYFYALSSDLNSYYQIIKLKLDETNIVQFGCSKGNKVTPAHERKGTSMNAEEKEKHGKDDTPKALLS